MSRPRVQRDAGSAVAEFVLVLGLVLLVGAGVFQLGLTLFVRNTLQQAASEGARVGARAGATPADGAQRSRELITSSLSPAYASDITTSRSRVGGVAVLAVTVRAPVPVLGLLGVGDGIEVTSRAFLEDQ